jgi:hypothetical protein
MLTLLVAAGCGSDDSSQDVSATVQGVFTYGEQ